MVVIRFKLNLKVANFFTQIPNSRFHKDRIIFKMIWPLLFYTSILQEKGSALPIDIFIRLKKIKEVYELDKKKSL
ncbi:MAG: hypothetical protein JWR67_2147 [Mucilaginibacter sp.]|nr:hypothetical protein [Mucilaginibacter sp.]